jgi:hypothetical protein
MHGVQQDLTDAPCDYLHLKVGLMPIRADNRKYYDARWCKFRLDMLEAAGNVCQRCGKPHRLLDVAPHPRPDRPAFSGGAVPELPR